MHSWLSKRIFRRQSLPVIVALHSEAYRQFETTKKQLDLQKIKARHFDHFPGFMTQLTMHQLDQLIKKQLVKKVYLDRKVTALLDVAAPTVMSSNLWDENVTGEGVQIAIIDTGIHPHPDLTEPNNRIVAFKDYVNGRTDPYDDNGHGTHCAGDAAGNGNASDGKYRGPAYEANLIGVKVLDKMGSGNLSDVMAGVEWCINQRDELDIDVISMSLGVPSSGGSDPLAQVVSEAWAKGLTVVAAAGNSGPEERTIASPGIVPEIITVGASDDQNTVDRSDDSVADFSSRGPTPEGVTKPDIVSPGVNIVSLRTPGSYLDKYSGKEDVNDSYTSLSGTSMATPIVAGIAAQLLQQNPSLAPDDVKEALTSTAESLGEEPNVQGQGLVNALDALEAIHPAEDTAAKKDHGG